MRQPVKSPEVTSAAATLEEPRVPEATRPERFKILLAGGILLLLTNFSNGGLIGIPVSFFLKNRLHLHASQVAVFNLWVGIPLFSSFVFGLLRDRWSPLGAGDRGHLIVFGLTSAAIYGVVAFLNPTYAVLLVSLVMVTCSLQMVGSASSGLTSTIGQRRGMAGQMGALISFAVALPALAASLLGGILSGHLEGRSAVGAARTLFLVAAGLAAAIAVFGLLGPRRLFDAARVARPTTTLRVDIVRLLKHRPIYPVLLIQLFWSFGPAWGVVMQYHLSDALHGSDAQWGLFNAIFQATSLPVFVVYGFLCQRVPLSRLLWFGAVLAVFQMLPLFFIRSATGALVASAFVGLINGIPTAAYTDLAIRSCPRGLQGTMMMLFGTMYFVSVRFGDLLGTYLYDRRGGFVTALVATIIIYALILPILLFVPKHLVATHDTAR